MNIIEIEASNLRIEYCTSLAKNSKPTSKRKARYKITFYDDEQFEKFARG